MFCGILWGYLLALFLAVDYLSRRAGYHLLPSAPSTIGYPARRVPSSIITAYLLAFYLTFLLTFFVWHSFWQLRSGAAHCNEELQKRRWRGGEERRGKERRWALSKSNNPHVAGGEKQNPTFSLAIHSLHLSSFIIRSGFNVTSHTSSPIGSWFQSRSQHSDNNIWVLPNYAAWNIWINVQIWKLIYSICMLFM